MEKTYCVRCGEESHRDNWCIKCQDEGWHWCEKCGKFVQKSYYTAEVGGLVCDECKIKYNYITE